MIIIMQAILYTRVSTSSQGDDSLNIQNQICLQYLNNNVITLCGSFQEIGSAYNGNQHVLHQILTNYSNCNLFVLNVSRFSRNITNGVELLKLADSQRINIHFIEENMDSSNISQRHALRVKISEAQLESENISRRLINRNTLLKSQGYQFGVPTYGNKAHVTSGIRKFKPDKYESNVIAFITQARNGTSCRQLNTKLRKVNPKADPIHFYDTDGVTKINYFDRPHMLSFQEIADLLNDYDISKRGKDWTASGVSNVFHQNNSLENRLNNISLHV